MGACGAFVAAFGMVTPDLSQRGTPVTSLGWGHLNVGRNAGIAGQEEGPGQGPQATRWPVCRGGLVVAGGVARCAATGGPDTDVATMGGRVAVAADVLAGASVAHALPAAQSQGVAGLAG